MVERSANTFDASSVQGEGAYVKLRSMSVGAVLDQMRQRETEGRLLNRIARVFRRLFRRESLPSVRTEQFLAERLRFVAAWNWVDDQGQPLPLPQDDPLVLSRLTQEEIGFIVACLNGERQSEEQKN